MRNLLSYSALAACISLLASSALIPVGAQGQQQGAILIEGGTLIDGNGGAPVQNAAVLVQGNRITQIGSKGQLQRPAGAQIINADGKYIVPGLIDAKSNYASIYGEVGVQITTDQTKDKWKNYIGLPPDAYADMDDAKIPGMVKLLVDHHVALEPDIMAADRGFSKDWSRVQQEDANFFGDPALKAYYPVLQQRGLIENVKSPSTYLNPQQIQLREAGFRNHMRFLKAFVDGGGRIVPASDIPQTP